MLVLLAPAKTLDFTPPPIPVPATRPWFEDDAVVLSRALRALGATRLRRLMKLSAAQAQSAIAELEAFDPASATGLPAGQAYAGEVYRAFRGRELDVAALAWAQEHLAILSGLYGILRPLDRVQPHRLEMATRLATPRGHNLYAFWGARITDRVNAMTAGHADRSVIDLASQELTKVLWPRSLAGPLVEVVFENWKDAARTPHTIPTPSRHARGLLARFVVDHRLERARDLTAFDREGYAYQPDRSSRDRLVFGRPFPGP